MNKTLEKQSVPLANTWWHIAQFGFALLLSTLIMPFARVVSAERWIAGALFFAIWPGATHSWHGTGPNSFQIRIK